MDFAAIDFETATPSRDSACAVGVCVVRGGVVADERSWLIQPPRNEYSAFHTSLHGISPSDTADAPPFIIVMEEVWTHVAGLPLVAHNASFDMSVLRTGFDACGFDYPRLDYYCTLVMSRVHWPNLPGYSLPLVLAQSGFQSHLHHDAFQDASACARIALRIESELGVRSIEDAARRLGVSPGELREWDYSPCSRPCRPSRSTQRVTLSAIPVAADADPSHPFFDADVAFTGTLLAMTREEAMRRVAARGGRPRTSVSKNTEYLVVGTVEYRSLLTGEPSSKLRAALELKGSGHPVVVMSEKQFLETL